MPLTVAVQMDPIERIRIAGDSTFALLLEAQARGHKLLHYTPDRLRLNGKRVEAMAEPLAVNARMVGGQRQSGRGGWPSLSPSRTWRAIRRDWAKRASPTSRPSTSCF